MRHFRNTAYPYFFVLFSLVIHVHYFVYDWRCDYHDILFLHADTSFYQLNAHKYYTCSSYRSQSHVYVNLCSILTITNLFFIKAFSWYLKTILFFWHIFSVNSMHKRVRFSCINWLCWHLEQSSTEAHTFHLCSLLLASKWKAKKPKQFENKCCAKKSFLKWELKRFLCVIYIYAIMCLHLLQFLI